MINAILGIDKNYNLKHIQSYWSVVHRPRADIGQPGPSVTSYNRPEPFVSY